MASELRAWGGKGAAGSGRRPLTPRIVLAASLAATLSVAGAGLLWMRFFLDEIRVQLARYTDEVVAENLPRCRSSPSTFGRDREVGRFDAYDASTLRSANPYSPTSPDPVLVARLAAGEALPARVYWTWTGARGGAVLRRTGASGPCSLFQLQWYVPQGSRIRLLLLLLASTLLALAGAVALSTLVVVRPLARRLFRLCGAAERVGDDGYQASPDGDADEIGELGRILDDAHERIRMESRQLRRREEVLERHLAEVAHDLRSPLTSIQLALEEASTKIEEPEARELLGRALTDVVYTCELTENLRLGKRLCEGVDRALLQHAVALRPIVERVAHRFALLGKHRDLTVELAVPNLPFATRGQPSWVEQAFSNVIHNAVTHGIRGGHVAVLLEPKAGSAFRLTVLDDGPSGPELESLGEGTFRPDRGRRRDPPGSGLALAVAAMVSRIHGWNFDLEAQQPRGRRVTIEGRLVDPEAPELDPPKVEPKVEAALPSSGRRERARAEAEPEGLAPPWTSLPGSPKASGWPPRTGPAGSELWRRLTPRLLLASGLAAGLSVVAMGVLWANLWIHEIVVGVAHYAHEVAIDNFPLCLSSPTTWSRARGVGRLDAYDGTSLRSANPESPGLDPLLVARLRAGEREPARFFWTRDGQWGGVALAPLPDHGPCSLFQLSFKAAPGSGGRGLGLLLVLTVVSLAGTTALSTVIAVRPAVSRLLRLRRNAEFVGTEAGYEAGQDPGMDAIGRLSGILDRAHARVRVESSQRKERQRVLERSLGDIAHYLRTPLTSTQLAIEQAARLLASHPAGELVRQALTDTVYAAELTENLRLATQLREGGDPLDGDPLTDLGPVVERVVARFSLLGRHRGVRLEGATPGRPTFARGHPLWAEQALANVVHNAVTHGPEGTQVAVLLETIRDETFSITVVDDGPGLRPQELVRLAERGFRTRRARQRDPGGSGLGLAIAAEICRRSGWSLRFGAEAPRGLRVTIEGPLAPSPRDRPQGASTLSQHGSAKTEASVETSNGGEIA